MGGVGVGGCSLIIEGGDGCLIPFRDREQTFRLARSVISCVFICEVCGHDIFDFIFYLSVLFSFFALSIYLLSFRHQHIFQVCLL